MSKTAKEKCLLAVAMIAVASSIGWGAGVSGQAPANSAPAPQKTAEQQFKNIQVLNDIPAEQLIPTMQFISASLGVQCEFCHVEHEMQKDDKKEKKTARKMIEMELAINKGHFENELEVTCYTCHRGASHPVSTPIVATADMPKPAPHVHDEAAAAHANLPPADQILDKYLAAVGGGDALKKIKSREQKGTIDVMGAQYPIEVYTEAPDKRISISHPQAGPSVTAFNGEVGGLSIPGGVHRMAAPEREAARIDAEFYFPMRLREMYKEFKVRLGEQINGRETVLVSATAPGRPPLRMYFDNETGLLLRLIRYMETPLGRNPTQIDYADYRETGGAKIPYRWTVARPNGIFTIKVDQVQQNVPIDEKLFVPPSEPPPAK